MELLAEINQRFLANLSATNGNEDQSNYKTYEELKLDYEALRKNVKSDQDIIKELVEQYRSSESSLDKKKIILEDLAYLLHQIDNAVMFADNNWIKILVEELDNGTIDAEIKLLVLDCLIASVQGNPKVQINALENNVLLSISNIFLNSVNDLEQKENIPIISKALTGISAIVRHFPTAQWTLFNKTKVAPLNYPVGHYVLIKLMSLPVNGKKLQLYKLKLKGLQLLSDMLVERKEAFENLQHDEERMRQYELVELEKDIGNYAWCETLFKTWSDMVINNSFDDFDLDFISRWFTGTSNIIKYCTESHYNIAEPEILKNKLELFSKTFNEHHSNDWDCTEIIQSIEHIKVFISTKTIVRDEL